VLPDVVEILKVFLTMQKATAGALREMRAPVLMGVPAVHPEQVTRLRFHKRARRGRKALETGAAARMASGRKALEISTAVWIAVMRPSATPAALPRRGAAAPAAPRAAPRAVRSEAENTLLELVLMVSARKL
jgi:hypothetical protein